MTREARLHDGRVLQFPDNTPDSVIDATVKRELGLDAEPAVQSSDKPKYGGFIDEAVGLAETGAQLASGVVATPIAGLHGIAAGLIPGGKTGAQAVEDTSEALTYQPRTDVGRRTSQAVAKPFEAYAEWADRIAEVSGDPDDVLGATAVRTAILGAPALFMLKGGPKGSPVKPSPKVAKSISKSLQKQPPPSVNELFNKGAKAFKDADKAGVVIRKDAAQGLAQRINSKLTKDGLDPTLHPRSTAALQRVMHDTQVDMPFAKLETLRKIAKDAAGSLEKSDRRFGKVIINEIDDFIQSMDGHAVTRGDSAAARASILKARDYWSRASKGELLEGLVDRAGIRAGQFSGSGFENAIRTEFRQLALNQNRMRMFTAAEQAAIKRVAQGGAIANGLRMVGKFAPRGVISTAISVGGGSSIGGPLGAVILPMVGEAGRYGATVATKSAARKAAELARSGGN